MIIITGAAGFIGSALIWGLNKKGITDICAVDALDATSKWKNFCGLEFSDYLDRDDFLARIGKNDRGLRPAEGIIHMGACSSTTEQDAGFLMKNNFEYTRKLARWCSEHKKRFLYASSAATYGDGSQSFSDEHSLLKKLKPLNMYGYSKHCFDLWAFKKGLLSSFVGIKYFNVYGPNEYHKQDMRSVVNKAFFQIREQKKIRLFKSHRPDYNDGGQKRDFLYIKDAVAMTLFLWENKKAAGIFNAGSGTATDWNTVAHALFKTLNLKPAIEYFDMPEKIRDQYQYYTCADISKLRNAEYAGPLTPLEEAVDDYANNYLLKDRRLGEA